MDMSFLPSQLFISEISVDVNTFGGYRHDHRAGAERFYDMQNMSSDAFPLLTSRKKRREVLAVSGNANGIFAKDALCYADGTILYYNGANVGTLADSPKQFAGMGSKIIIWPDKVSYDTESGILAPLGASFTSDGSSTVTISLCDSDGADFSAAPTVSATKPENAAGGALWLDTSDTPYVLKKYSANSGKWSSIETCYLKVAATGIGASFSAGDGIKISGCTDTTLNASYILQAAAADYIVIIGLTDATITQTAALTVSRDIPDLDFICELNNRIWGCSSDKHEIRCCKLGDPKNWECFQGVSTDSFTLTIGSDGAFTGCTAYGGNLVFFKQNGIIKILGTKPSNYQLSPVNCNGVAPGSEKSLVVANETLYYHSSAGVCAYNGATPVLIGEDLGGPYANAVSGASVNKYFISMQDALGAWHLFVYDTRRGMWHREDAMHAGGFARLGAQLYMLDAATKRIMAIDDDTGIQYAYWIKNTGSPWQLYCLDTHQDRYFAVPASRFIVQAEAPTGTSAAAGYYWYDTTALKLKKYRSGYTSGWAEITDPYVLRADQPYIDAQEWMFESGELIQKQQYLYPQKLILRVEMDFGANISVKLSYDGEGFHSIGHLGTYRKSMATIPIRLLRCDSLRLRVEGKGGVVLHSLSLVAVDGGKYARS